MRSPPPGKRVMSGLASLSLAASRRAAFFSSAASLQGVQGPDVRVQDLYVYHYDVDHSTPMR